MEDYMEYKEEMEAIDSSIMDEVLELTTGYDYSKYTKDDVLNTLNREDLSIEDFGVLLSPAALEFLEPLAQKAKQETMKHFGNSVTVFTPIYIANYCENHCVYCGFNCKNKINRAKLSLDEVEKEMQAIFQMGLKDILILTGESRAKSSVDYIGESIKIAKKYFTTIGIEIYPLNSDEYRYIQECGADFVSVYQETYNTKKYGEVHKSGPKRIFPYRFNAQERAILGGIRGVSFGALLGLSDFRKDAFAAGLHAYMIQRKYPYAEISFSTPRLRPYINNESNSPNDVHEKQLLQVMLAFRLFMPYAGITISTRERAGFRDNIVGLVATRISAGVSVGIGGRIEEEKGDAQFDISDGRSVDEVIKMLKGRGLQPVFNDYVRV